jgi:hypothetical protein
MRPSHHMPRYQAKRNHVLPSSHKIYLVLQTRLILNTNIPPSTIARSATVLHVPTSSTPSITPILVDSSIPKHYPILKTKTGTKMRPKSRAEKSSDRPSSSGTRSRTKSLMVCFKVPKSKSEAGRKSLIVRLKVKPNDFGLASESKGSSSSRSGSVKLRTATM